MTARLVIAAAIGLMLIVAGLGRCGGAHAAETGLASWYGAESGATRADGRRFDPADPGICAHRRHRLGTELAVTDLATGRTIRCTVRDRGPYVRGRIIDLSQAAARRLGILRRGVARVRVEVVR